LIFLKIKEFKISNALLTTLLTHKHYIKDYETLSECLLSLPSILLSCSPENTFLLSTFSLFFNYINHSLERLGRPLTFSDTDALDQALRQCIKWQVLNGLPLAAYCNLQESLMCFYALLITNIDVNKLALKALLAVVQEI